MAFKRKDLKVGKTVFGLWPGSGGLYFKGVIVELDPDGGTCDVKFEEGTTYTLLEKHVQPVDTFKALEPKSSQRQSRRRSSSASRSRSRSRTPGRKPKAQMSMKEEKTSEKKASPQSEKGGKSETQTPPKRSSRVKQNLFKDEKEDVIDDAPLSKRVSKLKATAEEELPLSQRRSTRLYVKKVMKESGEMKQNSDENNSSDQTKPNGKDQSGIKSDVDEKPNSTDTQNLFTAFLTTISYLSLVVFLYLICQKNKCVFKDISQSLSDDLVSLYNPFAAICVEGFYLALFLLSMIPTGELVKIEEGQFYRRNSLLSAVVLISSLLAYKHYFKISATKILSFVPQFLIPIALVILVLSFIVYFRTRGNRSSDASPVSQFVIGSTIHASFVGVNIKVFVHRAIHISMIALQCLALEANFEKNQTISLTLAVAAGMQIVFALESLTNDTNLLNTFDFNQLKTGFMYLTILLYPMMAFLITLSTIYSGLELPYYFLVPIGILFATGIWIKVASISQKAEFEKNPDHPSFAQMESLTTASNEKLLISGLWGWVRHPDCLGDIMIHFAFALPCGSSLFLPYFVAIFTSASLIYRAVKTDAADKLKYGPSWDRYCQRVPSRVIPHLF